MVQWYNWNSVQSILRRFTDMLLNTQELLQVFLQHLFQNAALILQLILPLKHCLNWVLGGSEAQQNTQTEGIKDSFLWPRFTYRANVLYQVHPSFLTHLLLPTCSPTAPGPQMGVRAVGWALQNVADCPKTVGVTQPSFVRRKLGRQLWGNCPLLKHMLDCINYWLPAKNFQNHSVQKWIEFLHAWRLSKATQSGKTTKHLMCQTA